jgi:hypothetical protein
LKLARKLKINTFWLGVGLVVVIGLVFWVLAQKTYYQALDYTFVIAMAFLHGQLGTHYAPSWLNELVPAGHGVYYSVFPLGAVLSVLPLSALVALGVLRDYPVNLLVALLAAGSVGFAYTYTFVRPELVAAKRVMLALWLVVGTWFMTNLLFAGAWQLALGFAVVGQLAALYWSVVKPRPFWAGLAVAVAFGNGIEVMLTAPALLAFLLRPYWPARRSLRQFTREVWPIVAKFCSVPVILGLATLIYNYARFGSVADFGYAHIPGVLKEPWYQHGIFSLYSVSGNAQQMLWDGWQRVHGWPYLVPTGWGGSIVLASPFLLLLVRKPRGDWLRIGAAWACIVVLTFVLWIHGNPGGWQYSYRYAMILLPWFLVLMVEYLPPRITLTEIILWLFSIGLSVYVTYLFMWSSYLPR